MSDRPELTGLAWVTAFLDEWNALTAPPTLDWVAERFCADFRHEVHADDPLYKFFSDSGDFTGHQGVLGLLRLNIDGVRQRSEIRHSETGADERVLLVRIRQFLWMVGAEDTGESFTDFLVVGQLDESLARWQRWSYFGDRDLAEMIFAERCQEVAGQ